jgi:methylated-DNA-[protein]-cysteine S-methyltransferase
MKRITIKTRIGWVTAFEKNNKIYKIKFGKYKKQTNSKVLKSFKKNLLKYFQKKTSDIKTNYELIGNSTQKKVWNEMKKIKKGNTKSYGELAKKFNLSPRHIGKICGQNQLPLIIPCHRIIRSDGNLGGFSAAGGTKLKKKILQFEKNSN